MKFRPLPSMEHLRTLLCYDAEIGEFFWKARNADPKWDGRWAGKMAGTRGSRGRNLIQIEGHLYNASRLAWKYLYGNDPEDSEVDHIDLNPANNRPGNIRLASRSQNCGNTRGYSKQGLPKGVGINKRGKPFSARISINRKLIHLGSFNTEAEAHIAYLVAARRHFGEFARGA